MEQSVKITFRNILPAHKEILDPIIREHAGKLEKFFSQIISCRVVVEKTHGRHHIGNLYRTI